MTLKFDKTFFFFSIFSFVLLLSAFSWGAYTHWANGEFNIEAIGQFYESSNILQEFNKKRPFRKIDYYVSSDRTPEAIHELAFLEKNVALISKSVAKKESSLFLNAIAKLKKDLNALLATKEIYSVFHVFKNKIEKFQVFVVENKWRTLTRLSDRLSLLIDENKLRRPGFYKGANIFPLIKAITRNIALMRKVTMQSILSAEQKSMIVARLNTMKKEVALLEKYSELLKRYESSFRVANTEFARWKKEIRPLFSITELEKINGTKKLQRDLIIFVALGLFLLLLSIVTFIFSNRRNKRNFEGQLLKSIQDSLIPLKPQEIDGSSSHFNQEFQKLREYVHKRMSLGTLFQEAIPLSSLLLDSNLNVIWGNDLFYETWKLEEVKNRNEQVTWDYLLQYTNLGQEDPIIDALQNGIAGIYNIQLKLLKDRSIPYEMYVSPIEYLGEKRIMIMFYPLQSFEETIKKQSAAIVGPVLKTIDALMKAEFDQNFTKEVKKDFEIANIEDVLQKFSEFNEFNNSLKRELAIEINKYKSLYEEKLQQLHSSHQLLEEKQQSLHAMMNELKMMKGHFVAYIQTKESYEESYNELYELQRSLGREYESVIMQSEELNGVLQETHGAINSISDLSSSFQNVVSKIKDLRAEILQVIDRNLLELKGHDITPMRQHELLLEIKNKVKSVDAILYFYGKLITKLDVSMSKVKMIADGSEKIELADIAENIQAFFKEVHNNKEQAEQYSSAVQEREAEVVKSLKQFFALFKEIIEMHRDLRRISFVKSEVNYSTQQNIINQ